MLSVFISPKQNATLNSLWSASGAALDGQQKTRMLSSSWSPACPLILLCLQTGRIALQPDGPLFRSLVKRLYQSLGTCFLLVKRTLCSQFLTHRVLPELQGSKLPTRTRKGCSAGVTLPDLCSLCFILRHFPASHQSMLPARFPHLDFQQLPAVHPSQ